MTVSLIIFTGSVIAIFILLLRRVPDIVELSENGDPSKDILCTARERIEEGVEREVKDRFEGFLQFTLSQLRKFFLRVEKITTKWLYALKRKRKKKDTE